MVHNSWKIYFSQNSCIGTKCIWGPRASRKVIPNRYSKVEQKNGGTVPVLIPAKLLKIMVKVMEVNKGCIKYQSGPKTFVCIPSPHLFHKSIRKHIARLPWDSANLFFLVLSQTTIPWYYFLLWFMYWGYNFYLYLVTINLLENQSAGRHKYNNC
jgi:hypothetical protein